MDSCLGGSFCAASPFIWDSVNPGPFLFPAGPGLLEGGIAPGNPPGSFNPRFSAREGLGPPARGTAGADWKLDICGFAPGGSRKLAGMPPGRGPGEVGLGLPAGGPPKLGDNIGGRPGAPFGGGAPWRPRWTACILASMSCETLSPLPRLEMVGVFVRGFRAAFIFPKGVEDVVMAAVVIPDVDMEWIPGRGRGSSESGLGPSGTTGGEGESRGASESNSSSEVDAMVGGGRCGDGTLQI